MKPPEQATATPPSRLGSHQTWLLTVCCAAQFMVILDLSIVNVALPTIQTDLGFSSPDLQWVVNAYAITFAGFLMLGGRAADFFGQKKTFAASLLLFALASLAGGVAPDQGTLIAARGVQGFAGALMAATSLAIITSSFQGPALGRAVGLWASMNGLGGAAGMLFGGIITETLGWRWILLINLPIGIASAIAAWGFVVDRRRSDEARFDIPGAVTLTLGQMVLIYGVVQASTDGWSAPSALIPIFGGIAILAAFAFIEARIASSPLIPFGELTKPLQVANTVVLLFSAALFPMWFIGSLYLQQVLGLSPLKTGLTFLPMALTIMFCARAAGPLVNKFGVRPVLSGGLTMLTTGMLLFTQIEPSGSAIVYVMLPGVLTAAGIALSIVPSTIAATQGAKEGQAGLASGLVNTSRQVGGGLGLALLITLATQHTSNLIGDGESVPDALTGGFRLGYLIGAAFAGAALILTVTQMPKPAQAAGRRIAPVTAVIGAVTIVFIGVALAAPHSPGDPIGKYTKQGAMSFVSQPDLHPPEIKPTVNPALDKLAPGYILVAPMYNLSHPPMVGQSGPLILDDNLQPIWFKPEPQSRIAGNLSMQRYQGRPVLTWWRGEITNTGQTLSGEYVVVDQNYRPVAKLRGKGGWILTLHTLVIDGDRAFVTANKNRPRDISKFGGAYNGAIIDSAVQEYDLTTGKLLHTWSTLDHIPPSASYEAVPGNGFPWDAYHVNSIQPIGTDKFLVSLRGTWAAYLVDIDSGEIEWTLGGKHSSFEFGDGAKFEWQHDVELHDGGTTVTLFDNHCCQITAGDTFVPPKSPTRPLTLKLDLAAKKATLLKEQKRADNFNTRYMGNAQFMDNGNLVVGWGSQPFLSEYDSSGNLILDGRLPGPDQTYRARRERWVGKPLTKPTGVARGNNVFASWNGATEVKSWRVRAGASATNMKPVATAEKSGFETAIRVPQRYAVYAIEALDAANAVLDTSVVFRHS